MCSRAAEGLQAEGAVRQAEAKAEDGVRLHHSQQEEAGVEAGRLDLGLERQQEVRATLQVVFNSQEGETNREVAGHPDRVAKDLSRRKHFRILEE